MGLVHEQQISESKTRQTVFKDTYLINVNNLKHTIRSTIAVIGPRGLKQSSSEHKEIQRALQHLTDYYSYLPNFNAQSYAFAEIDYAGAKEVSGDAFHKVRVPNIYNIDTFEHLLPLYELDDEYCVCLCYTEAVNKPELDIKLLPIGVMFRLLEQPLSKLSLFLQQDKELYREDYVTNGVNTFENSTMSLLSDYQDVLENYSLLSDDGFTSTPVIRATVTSDRCLVAVGDYSAACSMYFLNLGGVKHIINTRATELYSPSTTYILNWQNLDDLSLTKLFSQGVKLILSENMEIQNAQIDTLYNYLNSYCNMSSDLYSFRISTHINSRRVELVATPDSLTKNNFTANKIADIFLNCLRREGISYTDDTVLFLSDLRLRITSSEGYGELGIIDKLPDEVVTIVVEQVALRRNHSQYRHRISFSQNEKYQYLEPIQRHLTSKSLLEYLCKLIPSELRNS